MVHVSTARKHTNGCCPDFGGEVSSVVADSTNHLHPSVASLKFHWPVYKLKGLGDISILPDFEFRAYCFTVSGYGSVISWHVLEESWYLILTA